MSAKCISFPRREFPSFITRGYFVITVFSSHDYKLEWGWKPRRVLTTKCQQSSHLLGPDAKLKGDPRCQTHLLPTSQIPRGDEKLTEVGYNPSPPQTNRTFTWGTQVWCLLLKFIDNCLVPTHKTALEPQKKCSNKVDSWEKHLFPPNQFKTNSARWERGFWW